MEQVNNDADGIVITSKRGNNPSVLISQAEYDNMMETLYLLNSPTNQEHLARSIAQPKAGQGAEHKWDE